MINPHKENREQTKYWLDWAIELQALAQNGLTFSKDPFDIERYKRIRDLSAEIISKQSDLSFDKVKGLFCSEEGYQTPKIETRAAIFEDDKILMVREKDELWSLPGGWIDVNQTIKTNTIKEVKEEAGLDVKAVRIISLLDRNKYNSPIYAYNVCKVFVLCEKIGGSFQPNIETSESHYFALDELPPLAIDKNTEEQIALCFKANKEENWVVYFD